MTLLVSSMMPSRCQTAFDTAVLLCRCSVRDADSYRRLPFPISSVLLYITSELRSSAIRPFHFIEGLPAYGWSTDVGSKLALDNYDAIAVTILMILPVFYLVYINMFGLICICAPPKKHSPCKVQCPQCQPRCCITPTVFVRLLCAFWRFSL